MTDIKPKSTVRKIFRDDESAQRYQAGWKPYEHYHDPIIYELGTMSSQRAPLANQRLNFHDN